jgi:hypothetical protein
VTESTETTGPARSPFSRKVRTLAFGALATAALSMPAVSALSVSAHGTADRGASYGSSFGGSHGGYGGHVVVSSDSHRLALGSIKPASLRLS